MVDRVLSTENPEQKRGFESSAPGARSAHKQQTSQTKLRDTRSAAQHTELLRHRTRDGGGRALAAREGEDQKVGDTPCPRSGSQSCVTPKPRHRSAQGPRGSRGERNKPSLGLSGTRGPQRTAQASGRHPRPLQGPGAQSETDPIGAERQTGEKCQRNPKQGLSSEIGEVAETPATLVTKKQRGRHTWPISGGRRDVTAGPTHAHVTDQMNNAGRHA